MCLKILCAAHRKCTLYVEGVCVEGWTTRALVGFSFQLRGDICFFGDLIVSFTLANIEGYIKYRYLLPASPCRSFVTISWAAPQLFLCLGIIHNYCQCGNFSRGGDGLDISKTPPDIFILVAFSSGHFRLTGDGVKVL